MVAHVERDLGIGNDHGQAEHGGVPTTPKVAIRKDFADPAIIQGSNGKYYAFATGGNHHILQMSSASSPGGPWSAPSKVPGLTKDPSWAKPGSGIWAPDVHEVAPGKYIMYFSAQSNQSHGGRRAIGYATGTLTNKNGTWTWTWKVGDPNKPLIPASNKDSAKHGGAIDPSFFKDPTTGDSYIVYKNDGNSLHPPQPDTLWLQQVGSDGHTPIGKPKALLTNNANDDCITGVPPGTIIEAPQIVRHGNEYVMFYSTGHYHDGTYTERYATAKNLDGPWQYGGILLRTGGDNGKLKGPGGATVMGNVIVFHNITTTKNSSFGREMMVAKLQWTKDGKPFVDGGNP